MSRVVKRGPGGTWCLLILVVAVVFGTVGCETPPGKQPELNITRSVSPVSPLPTESWRPGMVVWADLVTPDLESAIEFYSAVFDWRFVVSEGQDYAEASRYGEMVGSFALFSGEGEGGDQGKWLISISVPDVDAAAEEVVRQGGAVLVPPEDLPNRGRYTLVKDAEGAMCMFLRATGGDPEDASPEENNWMWADLWSRDPGRAAAFYGATVGYRTRTVVDSDGESRLVFGRGGKARASVVKLTFREVESNWVPCLLVADVPTVLALVTKHGGSVVLTDASDPTVALVADREGAVFAIQSREVK